LNVQLEAKSWATDHVIGDTVPGAPARWSVATQIWMEENEFYGAEVAYQEDDYAWAKPIPLGKEDLLKHIAGLDPEFSFVAQTDHTMLGSGTEQAIRDMALKLLRTGSKIPGRFQIMGFIHKGTRLANIELFYQLAKEYGMIEKT